MAEFYSIIQNVYAVRTGIMLPEYDAISITLKRLTWFIQDFIEKLTTIPKRNKPSCYLVFTSLFLS